MMDTSESAQRTTSGLVSEVRSLTIARCNGVSLWSFTSSVKRRVVSRQRTVAQSSVENDGMKESMKVKNSAERSFVQGRMVDTRRLTRAARTRGSLERGSV